MEVAGMCLASLVIAMAIAIRSEHGVMLFTLGH